MLVFNLKSEILTMKNIEKCIPPVKKDKKSENNEYLSIRIGYSKIICNPEKSGRFTDRNG